MAQLYFVPILIAVIFSLGMYTAVADPVSDPEFTTFTLERDRKYIIPAIKGAMEVAEKPLSL